MNCPSDDALLSGKFMHTGELLSSAIGYGLPQKSAVQLSVFNTLGQQVAVLQNGDQEAGFHEVKFDGKNLSSGVYFYRIQAGEFVQTRKLVLLR